MPRKKLIRRFEPRYGVSEEMLGLESKYVAREQEDYLLLATNDLREKLRKVRELWGQADQVLERAVCELPEREKLAVQCMIVRDLYHLLELYCTHLGSSATDAAPKSAVPSSSTTRTPEKPAEKLLPFSEWLFDPAT